MKPNIVDAKRRVLLPELARILRVPGKIPERDGEMVPCFWPDRHKRGDARPSFNFHSGLTRFRCFGCSAAGDGPDMIAEWFGISQEDGIRRFLEIAGGELSSLPPVASRVPVAVKEAVLCDSFGDTEEKQTKRTTWPQLHRGTSAELATVARLRGLGVETCRAAERLGWLRFCAWWGRPAWALCSACGRLAQVRRLDGAEWERKGELLKSLSLPGSCASAPIGLPTLADGVRFVGIASGGPDTLALLELTLAEGREADFAILGILGESVKLAAPVVNQCSARHVRLFAHNDVAGRFSAAKWAEQLSEAGATVDAFDFASFGVKDLNDFLKLPKEARKCEALPG